LRDAIVGFAQHVAGHGTEMSRVDTEIDFDRDGRQMDFLRLPHSVDGSAYGWIPIPLVCLRNEPGPRVVLMAGNHGDEFEGQVALTKLAYSLQFMLPNL